MLCVLSISEEDPAAATRNLFSWAQPMLAAMAEGPQIRQSGARTELASLTADEPGRAPDARIAEVFGAFAAVGDAAGCTATVRSLLAAGADRVVLVPNPAALRTTAEMVAQVRLAATLTL